MIMSSHAATVLNGRCSTNRNYPRKSLSDAGYNQCVCPVCLFRLQISIFVFSSSYNINGNPVIGKNASTLLRPPDLHNIGLW